MDKDMSSRWSIGDAERYIDNGRFIDPLGMTEKVKTYGVVVGCLLSDGLDIDLQLWRDLFEVRSVTSKIFLVQQGDTIESSVVNTHLHDFGETPIEDRRAECTVASHIGEVD